MTSTKQKVFRRYLPGGMNIAVQPHFFDDLDEQNPPFGKKSQKKNKKNFKHNNEINDNFLESNVPRQSFATNNSLLDDSFDDFSHLSVSKQSTQVLDDSSVKNNCIPPKTICKNKPTVLDNHFGDNGSFKTPSTSKLITHDTCHSSDDNSFKETIGKPVIQTSFRNKLLQNLHKNKKSTTEVRDSEESNEDNIKNHDPLQETKEKRVSSRVNTRSLYDHKKTDEPLNEEKLYLVNEQWYKNNINFNNVDNENKTRGVPLLKTSYMSDAVKLTKIYNTDIFIHGMIIKKTPFLSEDFKQLATKALDAVGRSSPTELQSYVWPAIQKGFNVFMVGPSQNEKKLAYIPILINFVSKMPENYLELQEYDGPLVIIICTDADKCKEIVDVINNLDDWETIKLGVGSNVFSVKNCDILVTAIADLEQCLKTAKITVKRLCHVVLDEADVLLKLESHFVAEFLKLLDEMQQNRPHKKSIQIIASSEKWTVDLLALLKRLYTPPVVCFSDFLEAAIYSSMEFIRLKLNQAHKIYKLQDTLQHYHNHRSIVFCHNSEISKVKELLEMEGIECISISDDSTEDEICENQDMWSSLKSGYFKVLLCTDTTLEKAVHITNATWLFHYALPSDRQKFQNRFRCVAANMKSPLSNEDNCKPNCSLLFMDGESKQCGNYGFNNFVDELVQAQTLHLKL